VLFRSHNIVIDVVPVSVQGEKAENEICSALSMLNQLKQTDLIIIARGGGSLEDLAAFNSEKVARAVYASDIPVVSAVGHETDYTICDFVSDLRAPTPSAAAELVVPVKTDLTIRVKALDTFLKMRMEQLIQKQKKQLETLSSKLVDPKRKINDMRMLTEDLTQSLIKSINQSFLKKKDLLSWNTGRLSLVSPLNKLNIQKSLYTQLRNRLVSSIKTKYYKNKIIENKLSGKLAALNPASILDRGYSITRTIQESRIIKDSHEVTNGQELEIILSRGSLRVGVKG
jgi:exodeoxyribonuclease VII large subunit